jgi:hypothetical protein
MKTINIHSHLLPGHSPINDQISKIFSNQLIGHHYLSDITLPDDCPNLSDVHIWDLKVMPKGYGIYCWTLYVQICFGNLKSDIEYTINDNHSECYDAFRNLEYYEEEKHNLIIGYVKEILNRNSDRIIEDIVDVESTYFID